MQGKLRGNIEGNKVKDEMGRNGKGGTDRKRNNFKF